ncbi:hypothetical protein Mapa_005434 [Marchantia paleacea]|nr:hypothetical protein Mapa_005434 [Marchantia paleacea]
MNGTRMFLSRIPDRGGPVEDGWMCCRVSSPCHAAAADPVGVYECRDLFEWRRAPLQHPATSKDILLLRLHMEENDAPLGEAQNVVSSSRMCFLMKSMAQSRVIVFNDLTITSTWFSPFSSISTKI